MSSIYLYFMSISSTMGETGLLVTTLDVLGRCVPEVGGFQQNIKKHHNVLHCLVTSLFQHSVTVKSCEKIIPSFTITIFLICCSCSCDHSHLRAKIKCQLYIPSTTFSFCLQCICICICTFTGKACHDMPGHTLQIAFVRE